jgi:hypothetical protein
VNQQECPVSGKGEVLCILAEARPEAWWIAALFGCAVVARTLYLGIAMIAAIMAKDEASRENRYRIFHDLVGLFLHRGRR